jgi:hypothetical protein
MKLLILTTVAVLSAADIPKRPAKLTTEEALRYSMASESYHAARAFEAEKAGEAKVASMEKNAKQATLVVILEELRKAKGAPSFCFIDKGEWISISRKGDDQVPVPCEIPVEPKEVKK